MRALLEKGSAIRNIWLEGLRLRQLHGEQAVADMTLGNPTTPPPPALLQALEDVVAHPPPDLHRYTPNEGLPAARERIAEQLERRGLLPGARREHVLLTCGASAAINVALRAVLDPGDEVLLLLPCFPDYPAHVRNHQGVPVPVQTGPDFLPDLGAVEAALGPRTRALIVNHPNNPSGRQYAEGLLRELVTLLRERTRRNGRPVYLLSDEPYREVRYTSEPFVSPVALYEHGLMTYSFSKSHCIPGERIGYLAVSPEGPGVPELVAAAALANRILGFTNGPSLWQHVMMRCLDAVTAMEPLRRSRDRLLAALTDKGYEVFPPEGTFYLFPRAPGDDDEAFVERARRDLLLFVPGSGFGRQGYFRITYCVDEHTLELALQRLPPAREAVAARAHPLRTSR